MKAQWGWSVFCALLTLGVVWMKGALDLSASSALRYAAGGLLGGAAAGYCLGVVVKKDTFPVTTRVLHWILACSVIGMMVVGLSGLFWGFIFALATGLVALGIGILKSLKSRKTHAQGPGPSHGPHRERPRRPQ
jgi:hypothetical protein